MHGPRWRRSGDVYGMVADAALAARLDIKIGDALAIGDAKLVLKRECSSPNPTSSRPASASGPGSSCRARRVAASEPRRAGLAGALALPRDAAGRRPHRASRPAAPAMRQTSSPTRKPLFRRPAGTCARAKTSRRNSRETCSNFTQFLTLVGLTALIIGGVGVANAVHAFVDRKRADLATFKALGATGGRVFVLLLDGSDAPSPFWRR